MGASEPPFLDTLGQVGKEALARFDREPVLVAFQAWLSEFVPKFETLDGTDGGEWSLLEELTWPLFLQTVRSMHKGKAVGAGGFSIELLSVASEEVLGSLFEALMRDVRSGRVSSDWKRILYVLLRKPGNDHRRLGDLREIALMAQEMKLVLQMVRRVCYCRVARRVMHQQVGWVSGHGAFDPALTAAMVMQQARALRQDIYVLYIDLSSFFPSIHRGETRAIRFTLRIRRLRIFVLICVFSTPAVAPAAYCVLRIAYRVLWRGLCGGCCTLRIAYRVLLRVLQHSCESSCVLRIAYCVSSALVGAT